MDQQTGPLDMAEELVAQAKPRVSSLDQARDVGNHERVFRIDDDRPQVRILGGERVIGDLGMGSRDPREQGGLAGVGQPDQADVGDHLELQDDPPLLAGKAVLVLPRCPVGGRLEVGVAMPSPAAAGNDDRFSGRLQVAEDVSAVTVTDDRSRRNLDHQVVALAAETVRALAVLAAVGLPVPLVRQVGEVRVVVRGPEHDAAAMPAVAPVRAAAGRVLFTPKAEAAVAPVATSHEERHSVNEHEIFQAVRAGVARQQ